MDMMVDDGPVQAADLLKTELQDTADDLQHLRHFPQDTAGYCPDESNSVASDRHRAAAVVVAAVLMVVADEVAAVAEDI